MSEEDLKLVLAKYQQKSFDLFNKTVVLETQVETLTQTNLLLQDEIEKLKNSKKNIKSTAENF